MALEKVIHLVLMESELIRFPSLLPEFRFHVVGLPAR